LIDFNKLLEKKSHRKELNPIDIFDRLDKANGKEYLRPPQTSVLTQWHNNFRDRKDSIVKLHTGQGKTLIGLLILQSYLNEGLGPVVYLCPNNYLVSQTVEQANLFGINTVSDTHSGLPTEFKNSKAILVTTCNKMFNGKSVFGVTGSGSEFIEIGAVAFDDAHKCVDIIKDAYSINIFRKQNGQKNLIYDKLLKLFKDSLQKQGAGTLRDIESGQDSIMAIPFWVWYEKQNEVVNILQEHKNDRSILFVWDLLKNKIGESLCVFSGTRIQITPRLLPIETIPSFCNAKRRIFLSATLMDDSFLVRDLDIDYAAVSNPLSSSELKYSGERMILMPTLIAPTLKHEHIIRWVTELATKNGHFGVVALVPSFKHADPWILNRGIKTDVSNLVENINRLRSDANKKEAKEVLVMINEYDGVDLPDQTCRILCLDSLPSYTSLTDIYQKEARPNSTILRRKLAQMIEQGIGRAIRGSSDWCIVIIMGNNLTDFLSENSKRKYLSNEAQTQIKISEELTDQLQIENKENDIFKEIEKLINQCLNRNEGWKDYYREKMKDIPDNESNKEYLDISRNERNAEIYAQQGQQRKAVEILSELKSSLNKYDNGWYLQLMATYLYPIDVSGAMDLQLKAFSENNSLFRPEIGVTYTKLLESGTSRENLIIEWINNFDSHSAMIVHLNQILDNLSFGVSSDLFEKNLDDLGHALGLHSSRPEKEIGNGPDNLWSIKGKLYWILSCKNMVDSRRTTISKSEIGQISNDIAWFRKNYDNCDGKPIFIHHASKLDGIANIDNPVWVMNANCLDKLKKNIVNFYNSFQQVSLDRITPVMVTNYLLKTSLDIPSFNKYIIRVTEN
jgi:replicative superfamily II helicase